MQHDATLSLDSPETEAHRFSRRTIVFTLMGTMLVTFIATLDQTIVGTALPRIAADLKGFDQLAWVATIYMLTSTVTIPVYGKLSDLFGRKTIFLIALVVFLIGSCLSGAAQTMTQLIIFRAFQGLGAGGLESTALAIVADLFPPRERGRWVGLTSSSYALASIVGPLVGGVLTDAISWRWVFYINLPFGIVALFVLAFLMPTLHEPNKHIIIDYIGSALLMAGMLLLLLALSLGGVNFPWLSWQIVGLFAGSLVLLVLLAVYSTRQERLGREPVLEPSMFKDVRVFDISILAAMAISVALIGCTYFVPVFLQSVVGVSATSSGVTLIPMMLASIVGAIIGGAIITITGRYKLLALFSAAIIIAGVLLLLRLDIHSTSWDAASGLIVLGLGIGSSLALYTVVAQNALNNKVGIASSTVIFFRQLGQSIGLAAIGAVVTASYVPAFYKALPGSINHLMPAQVIKVFEDPLVLLTPEFIAPIRAGFYAYGAQGQAAYEALLNAVKIGLTQSINRGTLLSLCLMIATFVLVCFLKEIPLKSRHGNNQQ